MQRIVITASTLIFIPLLADTPHSAHMQQLIQEISDFTSTEFKQRYATAPITDLQRAELLQIVSAQRTSIIEELTAMNQAHQSMKLIPIAKGFAQLYIALLSGLGATVSTISFVNVLAQDMSANIQDKIKGIYKTADAIHNAIILKYRPLILANLVYLPLHMFLEIADFTNNKKTASALFAVPTLLAFWATYYCGKIGISNIRTGLNYKKHLEKQIKNLDEIIEFLQPAVPQ